MKGYLRIKDAARAVQQVIQENDLLTYEARRWFRLLITGGAPYNPELGGTYLKKGGHTYDTAHPFMRVPNNNNEIAAGVALAIVTARIPRFRRAVTKQSLASVFPNQIAYALGAAAVFSDNTVAPFGSFSAADFGLKQIGNVFGHPAGRRAFFNEPAIAPTGLGAVNSSGPLALGADEDFHFIYDVRIKTNGDNGSVGPAATYVWQRRPYFFGCYETGAGLGDFYAAGGSDTLSIRFPGGNNGSSRAEPNLLGPALIPNAASPTPSQLPMDIKFPTSVASVASNMTAAVSDEQNPPRLWFTVSPNLANDNVNASNTRSLWCWKTYSMQVLQRRDAPGQYTNDALTGFPTLGTEVQFRDLKMSRAGIMFLACDGRDDEGGGADNGALIAIDVTSGNEGVVNVYGTTAGGIYTAGGLRANNCLAVAVDRSETVAASGFDRVWVLHRTGLSYADINVSTKAVGAWTRVADAGADVNIIAANSIRGLANYINPGSGGIRNVHSAFLDVDSSGRVYWVSTATGGTYDTVGKQRINRLIGDASAHTFYSIDSVAEGGALGFINLGNTSGSTKTIGSMRLWRKDAADPGADVLWLATGFGGNANGERLVQAIPLDEWTAVNNPGASYYRDDIDPGAANRQWHLQVDRANNVLLVENHFNTYGILEPLGRADFVTGTVDQFGAPSGNLQTITKTGGTAWNSRQVGKRIRISGGTLAANRGSFIIDSFISANSIVIRNPGGASTGTGQAAPFDHKGTEFDTFNSAALTIGSTTSGGFYCEQGANAYFDDAGLGFFFNAYTGANFGSLVLNGHLAAMHQWSGSAWYRRRAPHIEAAAARAAHATAEVTRGGVKVAFVNQNAGVNEFFKDEYYTFGVSPGLLKDATQEITYGWDLYSFRSELIDERLTPKTAAHTVALGGFVDRGSLTTVASDDPFAAPTTLQKRHLATFQRQMFLDGTNGAANVSVTNGNIDTNTGFQVGLDVGSDVVAEKLKFCMQSDSANAAMYLNMEIQLWSATQAAGPTSWSLRANFRTDADFPEWVVRSDAFRNDNTATAILSSSAKAQEWIVDLPALAAATKLTSPVTNDAMRYWKFVIKGTTVVTGVNNVIVGVAAFDASGNPIGVPAAKRIGTAEDTNYLANYPILPTWLIDDDTTAGGNVSSSGVTVTLSAGSFSTLIGSTDVLRILDGGNAIVSEHPILSRDGPTQLTLDKAPDTPFTSETNWEVFRVADVRPRDNEGGGEDTPRFPANEFQVYIDPITGHIFYHDDAVTNSRVLRLEKYTKVKRSL